MKKFILLLIVPLLFFNSCEEEDENNCQTEPIQCGEIININVIPPVPDTVIVNENGVLVNVAGQEGYSIITLKNCSSGKEGTYCTTSLDFFDIYDLGDVFCPDINEQTQWGDFISIENIGGVPTPVVITGCRQVFENGPIPFN